MNAIVKEVDCHVDNQSKNFVKVAGAIKDAEIIHSIWALRKERNLVANEITTCKARLNIYEGKQMLGIHC